MIAPYRGSRGRDGVGPLARRAESRPTRRDDRTLVRPYLVTGGRTRPIQDGLRVEALVLAAPATLHAPLKFERRRVAELCQTPRSVAEIAAALEVPLGVARVLIADMATEGIVSVRDSPPATSSIVERIRDHVRTL